MSYLIRFSDTCNYAREETFDEACDRVAAEARNAGKSSHLSVVDEEKETRAFLSHDAALRDWGGDVFALIIREGMATGE